MSGSKSAKVEDEVSREARYADLIAFLDTNDIRKGAIVSKSVALEARRRAKELSTLMKKTKKAGGHVSIIDKDCLNKLKCCVWNYTHPNHGLAGAAEIIAESYYRTLDVADVNPDGKFFVIQPAKGRSTYDDDDLFQELAQQAFANGVPYFNSLPEPDSPESSTYEDSYKVSDFSTDESDDSDSSDGGETGGGKPAPKPRASPKRAPPKPAARKRASPKPAASRKRARSSGAAGGGGGGSAAAE